MARNYRRAYKAKRVAGTKKLGKLLAMKRRMRRKVVRNRTSVPIGLGFPKRMVMTHKYSEFFELTSTLGVINKKLISCNGMYQPDQVGGHQPLYFDQMTALYDHYTVIGSKIKITVTPKAANEDACFVGCYLDDDTTTTNISGISVLNEQTSGKIRLIPPNSNNCVYFTRKWGAKKTFGGSVLGNDNLQGNVSGNPAEQTWYALAVQSASAVDSTVIVNIEVSYIAVWDELRDMAAS